MDTLGHSHNPEECRLFIDSSKASLKAVLLQNGNKFLSVPLAHAINMKETYENMKIILDKIMSVSYTHLDVYKRQTPPSLGTAALQSGIAVHLRSA